MAMLETDLLGLIKKTKLKIASIEDESRPSTDTQEGTRMLVLNLMEDINAASSIPVMAGGIPKYMKVSTGKVHVAGKINVEAFLKGATKQDDGTAFYDGPMHLDVSKIKMNQRTGNVRLMSRVWLTTTKFSNGGATLFQDGQKKLDSILGGLFKGDEPIKLDEVNAAELGVEVPTAGAAGAEPKVVGNQPKEEKVKKAGA